MTVAKKTQKVEKNDLKKTAAQAEKKVEKVVDEASEKIEKFEAKADKQVDKLVNKIGFVDKIINASWMKEILSLSFMESSNKWVRKHLETVCKVLGILGLVGGVFMFICSLFALFTGSFWIFLINLILTAIVVIFSRGLMKMRKWFPAVSILCIAIDLLVLILSIFTKGISFGSQLLSVIISILITLFILKNKDMFKN